MLFPLALLISIFLIILVRINTKLMKKELAEEIDMLDDDLNKVILILKKNDYRMTQKEIRKNLPLSEAKISMLITELEAMGKIKKIKKGRSNIIVLNKKRR
jgi:uncharacterized membrane protein